MADERWVRAGKFETSSGAHEFSGALASVGIEASVIGDGQDEYSNISKYSALVPRLYFVEVKERDLKAAEDVLARILNKEAKKSKKYNRADRQFLILFVLAIVVMFAWGWVHRF